MKTAMRELIEHIGKNGVKKYPLVTLNLIKELLEKEKEQIKDAFNCGMANGADDSEQYYEETFKN